MTVQSLLEELADVPKVEKTLALIKPDAVASGAARDILHLIEHHGFTIVHKKRLQLTRRRAEEFYAEHAGKPFFAGLVEFMTSGPIYALCLAKAHAIHAWRAAMGPTNSEKARETAPKSLRALFGTDGRRNACHGSDSVESAAREIKFFFPRVSVDPVPDKLEAKAYLERQLGPALTRGLVELSKGRPTTDEVAALQWLSAWLLDNNPNKPRVRMVEEFPLPEDLVDDESGFVRHQAVDIELMEQSAVKIQAHIRGTLARRRLANKRAALEKDKKEVEELEKAAVRIQAAGRGMLARKRVDAMKEDIDRREKELQKEEQDLQAAEDAEAENARIRQAEGGHIVGESAPVEAEQAPEAEQEGGAEGGDGPAEAQGDGAAGAAEGEGHPGDAAPEGAAEEGADAAEEAAEQEAAEADAPEGAEAEPAEGKGAAAEDAAEGQE